MSREPQTVGRGEVYGSCARLTLVHGLWDRARHPASVVIHQVDGQVWMVVGENLWQHISGALRHLEGDTAELFTLWVRGDQTFMEPGATSASPVMRFTVLCR